MFKCFQKSLLPLLLSGVYLKMTNPIPKKPKHRIDRKTKAGREEFEKLQHDVLYRDMFTCQICRQTTYAPPHHEPPYSRGGQDLIEKMVTLCLFCHHDIKLAERKHGVKLDEIMKEVEK